VKERAQAKKSEKRLAGEKDNKARKHAITRQEKRQARRKARDDGKQASEADAGFDDQGQEEVDEAMDAAALAAIEPVCEQENATKKQAANTAAKRKAKLVEAKELLAEMERSDRPRRRKASRAMLQALQNKLTYRSSGSSGSKRKKKRKRSICTEGNEETGEAEEQELELDASESFKRTMQGYRTQQQVPVLDRTFVGQKILFRWNCGWVCGKIRRHYTNSKKYNFEMIEGNDKSDHLLTQANYSTNPRAPAGSWCHVHHVAQQLSSQSK
jgi:hypothetical protein